MTTPPLYPLFRQALEICRTALGENHPDYADQPEQPGGVVPRRWVTTPPLYPSSARPWRSTAAPLGENHPDYATSLNNLAGLYAATGRASEALPLMEQAAAIDDRMIGQILAIGSERQRIAFLDAVLGNLYSFLSLVLQHLGDSPAAVRAALDLVLRRKAIAAEAVATQRDAVLGGKYPALEPRAARARRPAHADRSQDARGSWT